MIKNVGIHGIGTYLPEQVRTNDWWPEEVVAEWVRASDDRRARGPHEPTPELTPEQQVAIDAIMELSDDPFRGSVERRVLPDNEVSSDMEIRAIKDLFAQVEIDPLDVDLLLTGTTVPDYLVTNHACTLHEAVGLRPRCFSLQIETACNSFQQQMVLAKAMLSQGRAKWALLVQSNLVRRVCPVEAPHSAWFGDGATAVLVGPVSEGKGLLGDSMHTNGKLQNMLVATTRGGMWWDPGQTQLIELDRKKRVALLLSLPETSKRAVEEALEEAGLSKKDVDFYASHQGTPWLRRVTQEVVGLNHARTHDLFPRYASLSGSNIPMILSEAVRTEKLFDGDVIATYAGGSGVTFGSLVMRWGV